MIETKIQKDLGNLVSKEKYRCNYDLKKTLHYKSYNMRNLRKGYFFSKSALLKEEIEDMIKYASTYEDLNDIGAKLNYAKDNELFEIGITGLQIKASKKMREIYNKMGEFE